MGTLEFLQSLRPSEVVFWTGAGISVDAPTCAPKGRELTDRSLAEYFQADLGNRLKEIYKALQVPNAAFRPRLETVLEALTTVYGLPGLSDVLSDLSVATPNGVHRFFARHLKEGGSHITANFDTCVERALPDTPDAHHFHGRLGSTDDLARLGARMSVIENGFPAEVAKDLDATLCAPGIKAIIFAGYSGSDFFDATPYLRSRWHLFHEKHVLWHDYQPSDELLSGVECDSHPLLAEARSRGAVVHLSRGSLRNALGDLAVAWGWPPLETSDSEASPWHSRVRPTAEQRASASISLAARMGLHKVVIEIIEAQGGPGSPEQADQYADALWGSGKYRAARAAWRRAFPGTDDASVARRTERECAVLWIRGQLVQAERRLRSACKSWISPDSRVPLTTQAALAETYGRVLTHMRRTPDTRFLSTPARRVRAAEQVNRIREEMAGQEGIHRRAKSESVIANLSGVPDKGIADHVASFDESEALHAWLSYQHHALRQHAEDGHLPTREDLEKLIGRRKIIGAHGDAALVFMLPGANQLLPVKDFLRAVTEIDITTWHRIRMSAKFLLPRLKHLQLHRKTLALAACCAAFLAIRALYSTRPKS